MPRYGCFSVYLLYDVVAIFAYPASFAKQLKACKPDRETMLDSKRRLLSGRVRGYSVHNTISLFVFCFFVFFFVFFLRGIVDFRSRTTAQYQLGGIFRMFSPSE